LEGCSSEDEDPVVVVEVEEDVDEEVDEDEEESLVTPVDPKPPEPRELQTKHGVNVIDIGTRTLNRTNNIRIIQFCHFFDISNGNFFENQLSNTITSTN
jgi:hypothetical protein